MASSPGPTGGTGTDFTVISWGPVRTFLALLQQEHEAWNQDLAALCQSNTTLTAEAFAEALAHIHYPRYSIYTITKSLVAKLLQPFQ